MQTESKHDLVIRSIYPEDLDEISALSIKCFGPEMCLKKEHFSSQLKLFPEGQACVEYKGKIVGCAISVKVNIEDYGHNHNYDQISDEGYIRNHNPHGKHMYGIEVGVDPDYRNMKVGKLLYDARRKICRELNLESIFIGGRMPNYHKYADEMDALEYAKRVVAGEIYDPVATFQTKCGFDLVTVMPEYIPDDAESKGYASLMEWKNDEHVANA